MFMKLKNFKKKIETVLFKRVCDEKKYIIFSSSIKNNSFSSNSYNILNYSLNNSLQKFLTKPLVNNFLKSSFFSTVSDFNIFFKRLRFFISLQRNKYNQISTQFQVKKRNWNESNLWDTWFRLLLIAKIDCFVNKKPLKWNFIKFQIFSQYHIRMQHQLLVLHIL